jgi:hypothetical protein
MPVDYFISYTSADKTWAEWIGWVLEEAGATVRLQAWDFAPGSNFVLEMQRAASAHRTIAVLSPDYLTSRFAAPEWAAAFAQDLEGLSRRLVPVRVRDCALEGMLRTIVHIDLVGLDEAAARKQLSDGLGAKRGKPDRAPPFPGTALAGPGAGNPKAFPGTSPGSTVASLTTPEPDMDWYLTLSRQRGTKPRCPFASVEGCPRYYQSLSLLGQAGSTKIPADEEDRLKAIWEKSDLWPRTDEGATSVSLFDSRPSIFSNFCPEVSYDRFHLFASGLCRYADKIDIGFAHQELGRAGVPGTNWQWAWASINPMHFTECPLYSPLTHRESLPAGTGAGKNELEPAEALDEKPAELMTLKPNFHGIGIDLKEVGRRIRRRFKTP